MTSNYNQHYADFKGTHPNFNRYQMHTKYKQDYVGSKEEKVNTENKDMFMGKNAARRVSFKNSQYCLPIVPALDS